MRNSSGIFLPAARRLLTVLAALCLAVACTPAPAGFRNTDLTGASFGRGFALADFDGRPRTLADFAGKAVILAFGYTACPDVCPTTLSKLAETLKALGPEAGRVQVLFVTLDPERDSAEQLKSFVPWFDPSFIGLRGDAEQTRQVAAEFRVFSSRREVAGGLGYVLDHSTGVYVFDPAGRLRLYVKDDAPVADLVADLKRLLAG